MNRWLFLAIGSVAGGFSRYILAETVHKKLGNDFPFGILIVNLIGCLLIGFFNTLAEEKMLLGTNERLLLMAGFCGAFTTFSALILDSSKLISADQWLRAGLNIGLSVALGLILFRVGSFLGKLA